MPALRAAAPSSSWPVPVVSWLSRLVRATPSMSSFSLSWMPLRVMAGMVKSVTSAATSTSLVWPGSRVKMICRWLPTLAMVPPAARMLEALAVSRVTVVCRAYWSNQSPSQAGFGETLIRMMRAPLRPARSAAVRSTPSRI